MKKITTIYYFIFTIIFLSFYQSAKASHALGADLTYISLGSNQFKIRLKFFRDCAGISVTTTQTVQISSVSGGTNQSITLTQVGTGIEVTPICPTGATVCNTLGSINPGVQQYIYEGTVTLSTPRPDYKISFTLCCRNSPITTLTNPSSQNLYVEALLNSTNAPNNSSPDFLNQPFAYLNTNQLVNISQGVFEPDGDSVDVSLVNALQINGASVTYAAGYSGSTPINTTSGITLNASNGNISFTPSMVQVGVFAVKVKEYRNISGVRTLVGEVTRDIQVTIMNFINNLPKLSGVNGTSTISGVTGSYNTTATIGTPITFNVQAFDVESSNLLLSSDNAIPGSTFTVNATGTSGTFSWTPTSLDTGINFFTLTVKDGNCTYRGINAYSYSIYVPYASCITPSTYTVTGGGTLCTGGTGLPVGLSSSQSGVNYQLINTSAAAVATVAGTGSAISFGNISAGSIYTVLAINTAGSCTAAMNGSATIVVNPTYTITASNGANGTISGASTACGSSNVIYQFYPASGYIVQDVTVDGISQGAMNSYTFSSISASHTLHVTFMIGCPPITLTVTGGGSYCPSGAGKPIGVANTQLNTNYQLMLAGNPIGSPIIGNGGNISFGNQTTLGTYSVEATNTIMGCTATMANTVNISLFTPFIALAPTNTNLFTNDILDLEIIPQPGATYSWAGPGLSSSTNTLSGFVTSANAGTYTASIVDGNTCATSTTIAINVTASAVINAKVILSGPYNVTAGLMSDSLRQSNLLPNTEPYGAVPYNTSFTHVNGNAGQTCDINLVNSINATSSNSIVDWVFLQLRDASDPSTVVCTRSALLQRDGDIVREDGSSPVTFQGFTPSNYYVSIKHRNHLGIMTATPIALTESGTNLDFTNPSTPLYSRPAPNNNPSPLTGATRIIGGKRALYAGNCNIAGAYNRFITYSNAVNSDRTSLFNFTGLSGNILGYQMFDIDMNGYSRFNGLNPDRLVILINCANNASGLYVNEQTPN